MKKVLKYLLAAVLAVAGCSKADSNVEIYPVPHQIQATGKMLPLPSDGFRLTGMDALDSIGVAKIAETLDLNDNAFACIEIVEIEGGDAAMQISGAYTLAVDRSGIRIGIRDDRSLFYAAQTLAQIIKDGKIAECNITDYPDVAFRGVVEGFYGNPWSFEDRVSQLRFYGRTKMNTYIFGPKDDPYHRSPYWREPYPEKEAANIRELVLEAKRNKVDFVWAMHPGMDIQWTQADRVAAVRKLNHMYDLGVRAFAVFFDDIEGEGTSAVRQADFMNYLKTEFCDKKGDIQQLIICPTEYNRDWAKTDYLDVMGEKLDPSTLIMWTGDKVVCDVTEQGLEWVKNRIRRPAYVWWNFPVSDYCLAHLLMGPVYGQGTENDEHMYAFVSNPMEFAEASKVALWSVSQYTWNMRAFDPVKAWEDACADLVPEAPEAFCLFCENNADIGPNTWLYSRDETFRHSGVIADLTAAIEKGESTDKLITPVEDFFKQLAAAPAEIEAKASNRNLIKEIKPWLDQTANVADAGLAALELVRASRGSEDAAVAAYNKLTDALGAIYRLNRKYRRGEQDGVRPCSQVIMPFILSVKAMAEDTFLPSMKPAEVPQLIEGSVLPEELTCYVEDNVVGITPHHKLVNVAPGEYFGFKIDSYRKPSALIYDLRKTPAEKRVLQSSADGVSWLPLDRVGDRRIDTIAVDGNARYFRLLNTSRDTLTVGIGQFAVLMEE